MLKNSLIAVALVVVIASGIVTYISYSNDKKEIVVTTETTASTTVEYRNDEYGFVFSLPENWKGYQIVQSIWDGNNLVASNKKQSGPKFLIRNPKWTSTLPYQDIPIIVFTIAQWNSYMNEDFSISAAPILATELGRNNIYIFALPPRWNFDYSERFEEAVSIVESKPLKAFDLQ
jgi:hypothetical protein